MTSDAFRPELDTKPFDGAFVAAKLKRISVFTFIGYVGVFTGYTIIFCVSLFTVALLKIRQAIVDNLNFWIALLDQQDSNNRRNLAYTLDRVRAERDAYRSWIDSLVCIDVAEAGAVTEPRTASETKAPDI